MKEGLIHFAFPSQAEKSGPRYQLSQLSYLKQKANMHTHARTFLCLTFHFPFPFLL